MRHYTTLHKVAVSVLHYGGCVSNGAEVREEEKRKKKKWYASAVLAHVKRALS